MKILCVGDSLCLPRKDCSYEDTWFYRVSKAFPQHDFINAFRPGLLIPVALGSYDADLYEYEPDACIIQVGICDCSPRYVNDKALFWKMAIKFSSKLGIETAFWKIIKAVFKRRTDCVYTSPHLFLDSYKELIGHMVSRGQRVIVVKIGHAAPKVLESSIHFNENVERYNELIEDAVSDYRDYVTMVDPLNSVDESFFVEDGYHCGPVGMGVVAEAVGKEIKNLDDMSRNIHGTV